MTFLADVYVSDNGAVLQTPYHAVFIEVLKVSVPHEYRTYDPGRRAWGVRPPYIDLALLLVGKYFPDAQIRDTRTKAKPEPEPEPENWAGLLFAGLPEHLHAPVYKALIRALHPDIGGDTRAAQTLNLAYDRLRGVA